MFMERSCVDFLFGARWTAKTGLRGFQGARLVPQFKTISNGDSIIRPISYIKKKLFDFITNCVVIEKSNFEASQFLASERHLYSIFSQNHGKYF